MVDPRVRRERLRRDLESMQRLRCEAIDFDTDGSNAPARYELRLRLRSLLGERDGQPIYTPDGHVHRIELRLPEAYPSRLTNDDVTFLTAPVFHPNVFGDGRICIRDYRSGETLARFVLRLARYIQCAPDFTGLDSIANTAAEHFFKAHPHLFPTDRTPLPDVDRYRAFVVKEAAPAATERRRFVTAPTPRRRFLVTADAPVIGRAE